MRKETTINYNFLKAAKDYKHYQILKKKTTHTIFNQSTALNVLAVKLILPFI